MNYFSRGNWWSSFTFRMLIWPVWSLDSKIEWTNEINLFFACWCNFMKINLKVLGVGMVKNGYGQSCEGILKLIVSEEWTDGLNLFFACWYYFIKIKFKILGIDVVKNGCDQTCEGIKLTVSEEWTDGINWFFCMLIQIPKN